MNALIKSATIIDKKSDFHDLTQDILIEDGLIVKVASSIKNINNYKVCLLYTSPSPRDGT